LKNEVTFTLFSVMKCSTIRAMWTGALTSIKTYSSSDRCHEITDHNCQLIQNI
jgi:hypothetical protein